MELSADITDQLRKNDNIVGYSEHAVELASGATGIRIYVAEDLPDTVPETIAGMPTEVLVVGRNEDQAEAATRVAADPKVKTRPLVAGISIGSDAGTGTLGYFVHCKGELCLMSSSHVLPDENGHVIQPGGADGGTGGDRVARIVKSIQNPDKGVDAAAAKIDSGVGHKLELNELGKVTGTGTAKLDQKVLKSGRTSGVTDGTVKDLNIAAKFGTTWFQHQIAVTRFSEGGDSGSLVVTGDLKAIGLLKGANSVHSWVNPIGAVLEQLDNATLAT
jgi:hypothetical protein